MADVEFVADRSSGRTTRLLAGVSVFALALSAAEPALAQPAAQVAANAQPAGESPTAPDQPAPAATTSKNAIIVTGIRASLRSARDRKKNAEQMVDSITATDIGALPDRSVSEALQRVPGVTLQRTNEARDPARLSAEGGAIFIRGLSWVRSEFNGRDTFSANNGRVLGFEDVPADMLAGVDVYKNPSADLIEGGIGGLVNLRTRKPFDQSGQLIGFSADVNYADLRKKLRAVQQPLAHRHRRSRHPGVGQLEQHRQPHRRDADRRLRCADRGQYDLLPAEQSGDSPDRLDPAPHRVRRIASMEASRHLYPDARGNLLAGEIARYRECCRHRCEHASARHRRRRLYVRQQQQCGRCEYSGGHVGLRLHRPRRRALWPHQGCHQGFLGERQMAGHAAIHAQRRRAASHLQQGFAEHDGVRPAAAAGRCQFRSAGQQSVD